MKAAIVAAAIGGSLAVVEGLLLVVLDSLAGLGEESRGRKTALTDGFVLLALGATVLTAVFVARQWPLVLGVTTAATAVVS
jgi:hypothetical protein